MEIQDFEVCLGYYADDKVSSDGWAYDTRKIIGEAYTNLLEPDKIYCKEFMSNESDYMLFWKADGSIVSEKFGVMYYTKGVFSSDGELYNFNKVPMIVNSVDTSIEDMIGNSAYRKIPIEFKLSDGNLESVYKTISLTDFSTKAIKSIVHASYLNISLDAMEKLRSDCCSLELFDRYIVINNGLYIYDTSLCEFSGDVILPSDCKYFDVYSSGRVLTSAKSLVFPKGIKSCSKGAFDRFSYGDAVDLYFSRCTDRGIILKILDLNVPDILELSESQFLAYINKLKKNIFSLNFY